MRIILREYLATLKESREFDVLLPDLLRGMGIVPISHPQIGVRQAGVDVAGVGNDSKGTRTLWLFVLKQGDIGRNDWDGGPQSIRPSLNQIQDVFLRANLRPEHTHLPVKIVVATTGDFKQDNEQDRAGYAARHSTDRLSFEFWSADHIAALIEQYLLDEYALPEASRSQLRRALALIGEPDYDLQHYYALLRDLFTWDAHSGEKPAKQMRLRIRALVTTSLATGILNHWARQENNLRGAVVAAERTVLFAWDAVRKHGLAKSKRIMRAYGRLIEMYLDVSTIYFNRVQPHLVARNAIARYYGESSLLNERIFEEIGRIATIGLSHLLFGYIANDQERGHEGADAVADTLQRFLQSHPASASPCYDAHCIDISLALLLFCFTNRADFAKSYVGELVGRLVYAYQVGKWFPIATDSFDDLVAFEIDRNDVDLKKLKEMSWMMPTIAQWAAALGAEEAYVALARLGDNALQDTCFQLWYPDEDTDSLRYGAPAHHESGITQAPIELPASAEEMRREMLRLRTDSPIKDEVMTSAARAGLPFLDYVSCRHFRIPLDPAFWQKLVQPEAAGGSSV